MNYEDYLFSDPSGILSIDISVGEQTKEWWEGFAKFLMENRVTSLKVTNSQNLSSVPSRLLYCCSSLTSVDLAALSDVDEIGSSFLSLCSGLTTMDLTPLINVRKIGAYFLGFPTKLRTVVVPRSNQVLIAACNRLNEVQVLIVDAPNAADGGGADAAGAAPTPPQAAVPASANAQAAPGAAPERH